MKYPELLTETDVARIRRQVYGGNRFDSCELEFAAELEKLIRDRFGEANDPSKDHEILPCPLCGKVPNLQESDTLHQNGTVWVDEPNGFRHYHHRRDKPESTNFCYDMNCVESAGGCGMVVAGDSKEEALAKWQSRAK